jgi:hypothetical protein
MVATLELTVVALSTGTDHACLIALGTLSRARTLHHTIAQSLNHHITLSVRRRAALLGKQYVTIPAHPVMKSNARHARHARSDVGGKLGINNSTTILASAPKFVGFYKQVSCGDLSTCAIGTGTASRRRPSKTHPCTNSPGGMCSVVRVVCNVSCSVFTDDKVYCWGGCTIA